MARRTACITRWWTLSGTAALDKMMDFINNFVAEIRALAKKLAGKNPEAQAMLKHEEDWAADILRAYDQLMEKAGKREAQQRGNGQARKENEQARYSTKAQDQLVEDKYFQRAIDAWDGTSNGGRVKIGVISEGGIYEGVGLPNGVLYMDYSKLAKALSKHGDHLNKNILKQIPQMLASPVVITQPINPQVKNTVNVFGDLMGDNGKPIMVSIMMRPNYAKTGLDAVIRTVEMRSDDKKLITPQSLLYANPNKKRTHEWLLRLGNSSVPFAVSHPGVIRSITYESKNSNVQGENSLNEADTQGGQKPLQFSLRNVDEDMAEMQRVMEENKRLRELVGKLNDTLSAERGNGKHIDRKAVRKIAREMKKKYQSTVSVDDLAANLQKAFDAMASAQSTGDAESAMAAMGAIAKDMLEKSDETDTMISDRSHAPCFNHAPASLALSGTPWKATQASQISSLDIFQALCYTDGGASRSARVKPRRSARQRAWLFFCIYGAEILHMSPLWAAAPSSAPRTLIPHTCAAAPPFPGR